jgi:hypothetical protein
MHSALHLQPISSKCNRSQQSLRRRGNLDILSQEVLRAVPAWCGGTIPLASHDWYPISALAAQIQAACPS